MPRTLIVHGQERGTRWLYAATTGRFSAHRPHVRVAGRIRSDALTSSAGAKEFKTSWIVSILAAGIPRPPQEPEENHARNAETTAEAHRTDAGHPRRDARRAAGGRAAVDIASRR